MRSSSGRTSELFLKPQFEDGKKKFKNSLGTARTLQTAFRRQHSGKSLIEFSTAFRYGQSATRNTTTRETRLFLVRDVSLAS